MASLLICLHPVRDELEASLPKSVVLWNSGEAIDCFVCTNDADTYKPVFAFRRLLLLVVGRLGLWGTDFVLASQCGVEQRLLKLRRVRNNLRRLKDGDLVAVNGLGNFWDAVFDYLCGPIDGLARHTERLAHLVAGLAYADSFRTIVLKLSA